MKRVVITGMGAVTPLGNDVDTFWKNSLAGESGAATITHFNPEKFKVQFAAEVKNFTPEKYLDRNEIKRSDLFTQFAIYASAEAMEDSGLDLESIDPFDIGVIWGTGQGGMQTFEDEVLNFASGDGTPRFSPFFVPKLIANMASGMISMKYGLRGINYTTVSACATANTAFMDAFNYIRWGKAKIIVSGGSEAPITQASVGGFSSMKAMSTRNDDPKAASRPYDVERDGFIMGEGAGALVMEEYEHAKARGAKIYAEITFEQVDYLNPHATSTPLGDLAELNAITKVFKGSPNLDISATKSMTGHLLGAAGAVEAILCIKAIQNSIIPPTINISKLDENIPEGIHIVTEPKEKEINIAMSNAFGFGGHNSTVIFRKI